MNDFANNDDRTTPSYADVHAKYQDGVREVQVSVSARSEFRLVATLYGCCITVLAIAFVVAGENICALITGGALLAGAAGAIVALRKKHAATSEESGRDKASDTGFESISPDSTRRIA